MIREFSRIMRIWGQTLVPPVITATLYFIIFGNLIGGRIGEMVMEPARKVLAAAGLASVPYTLSGEPAPELARFAQACAAEFIVLGTRGLGAVGRALLGSTALQLAHLSPVPLVWVP